MNDETSVELDPTIRMSAEDILYDYCCEAINARQAHVRLAEIGLTCDLRKWCNQYIDVTDSEGFIHEIET